MLNLRNRHFLKEIDFTRLELEYLLTLAGALKIAKLAGTEVPRLQRKEIALIFEKTSTRTRSAFEVAAYDEGAHVTYLDPSGSQIGHKESTADTARVLGRMYDAIEYRGAAHSTVEELAEYAGVPVYNGLTDDWHPTQMLADFLTMYEASRKPYDDISYCYMGDARSNMGRSLLVMGAIMGSDVRICAPRSLWPPEAVQEIGHIRAAESGARLTLTEDPAKALPGADFVHTDVWVSMGEPKDVWDERVRLLAPYQVNADAMKRTGNPRAKFMHPLPAFHDRNTVLGQELIEHTGLESGLEVTDEVFESPRSIVFDQAENRLHTIKAVLVATLG
ncbi:MAG: ornithine carbamoyltransferase [Chloroflexi bacterium HGW-Chloroflexi-9]|nr:MAG: ornithine carbamoyltransferase [Chloroflexi bacterium HGW-Chloroflexi-9]